MKNVIKHHQHTNYCIIMMKKILFENIYTTPTTCEKKMFCQSSQVQNIFEVLYLLKN